METETKTPKVDNLHRMSYSELKKAAKMHGIKGNMKASKIIAALSLINSDDKEESFSTPVQQEINSSKKNKEEKFDEDKMTPLATPRRGTYTIESPEPVKLDDSIASMPLDVPIFDISNVTISRGSERKLRPRKVNFMSPLRTPSTPKNSSIRHRPKTPMTSRTPIGKQVSISSPALQEKENILPTTQNSKGTTKSHISKETSAKIKRATTPNFKKIHEHAFNKMESIVDYQKRKVENSAKKIGQRPNLKPKATKFQSKIPAYAGIPFITTIQSSGVTSLNQHSKPIKELAPVADKPKTKDCRRNKAKFDLKASLSRKLGYKPYSGPLKPLAESSNVYSLQGSREPMNKVVQQNRFQTRSALRGVRTNKRFELQMKNRKLD